MEAVHEMEVSVLVVVRNEESFIRQSLEAMIAQSFDGPMEFLIIDGASTDATREIAKEFERSDPRLRVVDNPKRTLASGLNLGLAHASGEFVVQMEGHTFYPPEYISHAVARLRRGDVDWVSGRPVPLGIDPGSRRVALALGSWLGTGGSRKWRLDVRENGDAEVGEADLDTGVFGGAWRREALERYGGWDEAWSVNRDAELAARILADGGRIVSLAELSANYVPRSGWLSLARQYGRYGFYRAKTARAHANSLRRSHLLPPGLVIALAGAVARKPRAIRGGSRFFLGLYLAAVAAAAARSDAETTLDAAALPAVYATMHLAWGFGFLAGCVRFGVPLRALGRLAPR